MNFNQKESYRVHYCIQENVCSYLHRIYMYSVKKDVFRKVPDDVISVALSVTASEGPNEADSIFEGWIFVL